MSKIKTAALSGGILLFGIVVFLGLSSEEELPVETPAAKLPAVNTIKVGSVEAPLTLNSRGRIEPLYRTHLSAEVSGRIEEVADRFNSGELVEVSGVLLKIEQQSYNAALLKANAQLSRVTAEYAMVDAQAKVAAQEWRTVTNVAPSALSLHKPQLARETANIEAAKAELLMAQRDLDKTIIRAPFNAVIEMRSIGMGQYVERGEVLGTVMSTDTAEVRLPLSTAQLKQLKSLTGKRVTLTDSFAQKRLGKIVRMEHMTGEHSVNHVIVRLDDPLALQDHNLPAFKFGDYVVADIELETLAKRVAIPSRYVQQEQVWVVDAAGKLSQRKLVIEDYFQQFALIASGLNEGDELVVTPLRNPVEGMLVEVKAVAAENLLVQNDATDKAGSL